MPYDKAEQEQNSNRQKPHDRSICPISEEAGISKEEK